MCPRFDRIAVLEGSFVLIIMISMAIVVVILANLFNHLFIFV